MPPNEIIDGDFTIETDTGPSESDTDTSPLDSDTDRPTVHNEECFEAMICIALSPGDELSCLNGLEGGDAVAAADLAFCLVDNCTEAMNDLLALGLCLAAECPDETVNCIGFSLF